MAILLRELSKPCGWIQLERTARRRRAFSQSEEQKVRILPMPPHKPVWAFGHSFERMARKLRFLTFGRGIRHILPGFARNLVDNSANGKTSHEAAVYSVD
jgi:hypothetical protein